MILLNRKVTAKRMFTCLLRRTCRSATTDTVATDDEGTDLSRI